MEFNSGFKGLKQHVTHTTGRNTHIFHKSRSHLKILRAGSVTPTGYRLQGLTNISHHCTDLVARAT
jgi:hypothetical protein